MVILCFDEMNDLHGRGKYPNKDWGIGFTCGATLFGAALLYSNPVTGTLAAMGSGFILGSLAGSCAGLLSL
jgi:hypothetical protein